MKSRNFVPTTAALFLFALLNTSTAFSGNEGPSGKPATPSANPAMYSLNKDTTPGMIQNGQSTHCSIDGNQVTYTVSQNGQSSTSYGVVTYDETVPSLEAEGNLIGEAYQGAITTRVGHPDSGSTVYSAQIGQSPPTKILHEDGMTIVDNASPAAQTLIAFISRNCYQVTTPTPRQPIAQVQITAPIPRFVPEIYEIDADGSAVLIKGSYTTQLATLSQEMVNQLRAEIESIVVGPLVDPTPSAPNCLGGQSQEFRAFKQDGSGLEIAAHRMCHTLRLANQQGELTYTTLGGLENLHAVALGAAVPLLGEWGTAGANLSARSSGILIDMACARADIAGVVAFDRNGHFEADGTYTQEGGAYPVGGFHSLPAHFSGQLKGDELDITIQYGNGDWQPYTYKFRFGQTGHFARCA